MSKLRGQGRLLVLIAAGLLVVYVMYNFMGRSSVSTGMRSFKDKTVLRYEQLAGKVDLHAGAENSVNRRPRPNTYREMIREAAGGQPGDKSDVIKPGPDQSGPHQPQVKVENPGVIDEPDELDDHDTDLENEEEEEEDAEMEDLRRRAQLQKPNGDIGDTLTNNGDRGDARTTTVKSNRKKFSAFVTRTEPEPFPLYTDPDPNYTQFFAKQMRLVHLDLKGAPPKMSYLAQLFPLFSKMGATGLLIEYEDTFPYSDNLNMLSAKYAYTKENIKQINELAKNNELQIIPLVQTFGHMEFVLKGRTYQTLREQDKTPQIISPRNESMLVIKAMIEQVKALHPYSQYFHIGCDEVYQLGAGKSKKLMDDEHWSPAQLFFSHVKKVVNIVVKSDLKPIMWDDMFRKLNVTQLQESGLGGLVEPMIWQYSPQPQQSLPVDIWRKYGQVFKHVWVASSFKGATGAAQYITDASIHLENHLNWVEIMKQYGGHPESMYVTFKGIALTGWQRYDHFATLCELLPVALPSLAACLQTVKYGYFNEDMHGKMSQTLLQCDHMLELRLKNEPDGSSKCKFPGSEVYYAVQKLYSLHQQWDHYSIHHRLTGWMSSYNMRHNFSNPGQMGVLIAKLEPIRKELMDLRQNMSNSLSELFDQSTVAEFLEVQIEEFVREASNNIAKAKSLAARRLWPLRPLLHNAEDELEDVNNPQLKLVIGGEEATDLKSKEEEKSGQKNNDPDGLGKPGQQLQSEHNVQEAGGEQKIPQMGTRPEVQQAGVEQKVSRMESRPEIQQAGHEQKISQMGMRQDIQQTGDEQKISQMGMRPDVQQTGHEQKIPQMGMRRDVQHTGEQKIPQMGMRPDVQQANHGQGLNVYPVKRKDLPQTGQNIQQPGDEKNILVQSEQTRGGQNIQRAGLEGNMIQLAGGVELNNQPPGGRLQMRPPGQKRPVQEIKMGHVGQDGQNREAGKKKDV